MQSNIYSVGWVQLVFPSRTVAEELLLPEREAGNLTFADYEKAINFLPRATQYAYRPIGGLLLFSLAAFLGVRYRRPYWTNFQAAGAVICLGFTGFTLGQLNMVKAHAQFLRSIENPKGFSNAMRNIESRTGLHNHRTRGLKFTTVLGGEDEKDISHEPTSIGLPSRPQDISRQSEKALSKWDEIRLAQSRTSTRSSWDMLLQKNTENVENPPSNTRQPASHSLDQTSPSEKTSTEQYNIRGTSKNT